MPGTGKGLLADCLIRIFNPIGGSLIVAGRDEEEWRKRITASLISGISHILIDNVKQPVVSGSLAAALTAPLWTDRILGQSKMVTVPNRQTWVATGNNISADGELARRFCWIRLDSNHERPWQRKDFKHPDLRKWVQDHRGELITAALVLVRNWFDEGCPEGALSIGSFESWSRVIGGILGACGIEGFMDNTTDSYVAIDSETALWSEFVKTWWDWHGDKRVAVKDLFPIADSETQYLSDDGSDRLLNGLGVLDSLLDGYNERARKVQLGKKLARMVDQVIAGHKIVSAGAAGRAKLYRLQALV